MLIPNTAPHLCVTEQRARQRQQLLLARAQRRASLSQLEVQAAESLRLPGFHHGREVGAAQGRPEGGI